MHETATKSEVVADALRDLMGALCDKKDELRLESKENQRSVVFSVYPSHKDYGRIIGAKAKTFKSFELIAKLMMARDDKEAELSVLPPKVHSHDHAGESKFKMNPKWGKRELLPLVRRLSDLLFERGGVIDIVDVDAARINVEIKVNASEALCVVDGGDRVTYVTDRDDAGEDRSVEITLSLIEHKLRTIFNAIGLNNGRKVGTYLTGIHYPGE